MTTDGFVQSDSLPPVNEACQIKFILLQIQLRQLDPALRISNLADWLPIQRPEHLSLFADGLRKAGLPE